MTAARKKALATPRLSVVIATYNRTGLLQRLLTQLAAQTLPKGQFEVVVVDDGSREPVRPLLAAMALPFMLRVEQQENAGAAAARHRGALAARADVLVIIDDDMQVAPEFLEEHLRHHETGERVVVLGHIRADPSIERMPVFERWHQALLDRMVEELRTARTAPSGNILYTGNVSMRREDYLGVGGFDPQLKLSEDRELGLRLEKSGVRFTCSEAAYTLHGSDRTEVAHFLRRAFNYGIFDHRIARKHPDLVHANPWRFLAQLNVVSRPFIGATLLAPGLGGPLASAAMRLAGLMDGLGLESVAVRGTTLAYAIRYHQGLRTELGTLAAVLRDYEEYRTQRSPEQGRGRVLPVVEMFDAIAEDVAMRRFYERKYVNGDAGEASAAKELVHKIGLQIMVAYRWMRMLRGLGLPLAAKLTSRLIRHAYGSDIHWDAELAPGVVIVHGMGLAISHAARVEKGVILFQNVTLGMGTDRETGATGAPHVGANVHIGPGATVTGPVKIGASSKLMAGVVVTSSVPEGSRVEAPQPRVVPRRPTAS